MTAEPAMSSADSMPSAIRTYELPNSPAEIFAAARTTFTIMPVSATRAPLCILLAGSFAIGSTRCAIMEKTCKAAIYETHGIPAEVLRVAELPLTKPAPNEVVVKMSAAPIHSAELDAIEGQDP